MGSAAGVAPAAFGGRRFWSRRIGEQATGGQASAAQVAATSITIAAIANTLVKCGLVLFLGSWARSWRVLIATGLVIIGGGASVIVGLYFGS